MSQQTNPDLITERLNSTIDLAEMKKFLGVILYGSNENHADLIQTSLLFIFNT